MSRKLDPKKQKLLDDGEWLYEQHVTNLYGIAELARNMEITPNVVRKAVRKFNIPTPSQQQLREASNLRKYGVKNPGQVQEFKEKALKTMTDKFGGHVFSKKGNKAKRDQTCLEKYGYPNAAKSDKVKKKIRQTKNKDVYHLLADKNWLHHQHYSLNKSISEISTELKICWSTVRQYFKDYNIPVRPDSTIPFETEKLLKNREWLYHQYIKKRKPFTVIARELNIQDDTVRRYANRLNLPILFHSSLSSEIYDKLTDHQWLYEQCVVHMKNYKQIGEELRISPTTVANYCKQSDIQSTGKNRKLHNEILLKLENENWLYDQHHDMRKPLVQISTELGLCKNTPTNSGILTYVMRKFNIPVRNFSHSAGEKQVLSFVQQILPDTEIQENTQRIISPHELDIYIPDHNLAIEYCGLYWHSDKFKENYYHRNKMHACQKQNIRLLTIFEDEWRDKQEIIESKIKNIIKIDDRFRIFARNTNIVNVTTKTKNRFLDQYHIQGTGPGSITYGLVHNNEPVAVMTFIKRTHDTYELNRYATSHNVVGGFSKILKHFQRNHNWTRLISFADMRWSEGTLYETTGWELDKILPPDYFWAKNGQRYHKFNFRHTFLEERLDNYDPTLSENDNCKNNGYSKIYNCGLKRYIMTR